jgi:predicted nucleic acid-binding protein
MSTLLDTNLLTRAAQPSHPMYQVAVDAVAELRRQRETLHIVPQNLYEFWVVATRPLAQNGLALTPGQAEAEVARLTSWFAVLPDGPRILPRWQQLVVQHQIVGKNAHDARLVATMLVHGINRLLTFNTADFARYQQIIATSPQDVVVHPPGP